MLSERWYMREPQPPADSSARELVQARKQAQARVLDRRRALALATTTMLVIGAGTGLAVSGASGTRVMNHPPRVIVRTQTRTVFVRPYRDVIVRVRPRKRSQSWRQKWVDPLDRNMTPASVAAAVAAQPTKASKTSKAASSTSSGATNPTQIKQASSATRTLTPRGAAAVKTKCARGEISAATCKTDGFPHG